MSFKCSRCDKIFGFKHHLNNHLNKKNPCKNNNDDINIFKCLLCDKKYGYEKDLIKHKKTHENYDEEVKKLKNNEDNENNEIKKLKELFITQNKKLYSVIDEQKKEIEILNKKIENITNNTINTINNTTNNMTNNTTNIINNTTNLIIAFGSEEYKNLNKNEIKKILFDTKVDPLLGIIEYTHFNDRLPQQQNIRYNNIKSKYINIHDGTDWKLNDLDTVLDELLENNIYSLDKICEMITEEYKPKIKKAIKTIIDDYYKHYKLDTEEKQDKTNKDLIKTMIKTKNDIRLCIYNKSKKYKK